MDANAVEALQSKLATLDELIERAEQETPRPEAILSAMRRLRDETEEKLRKLST